LLLRVSPWGSAEIHGGQLRSQQIAGLVARALPDAVLFTAEHPRALSRSALATIAARGAAEAAASRARPAEGFYTAWVDTLVARHKLRPGDLVIYDADPRYGPALTRVAARRRLRVVALPHNIEALLAKTFPIHVDVERAGQGLAAEMRWLARADAVWAIGRLDQDIFQLFGIAAALLPYAPPPPRAAELLALRADRASAPGRPLLILGTAHNVPTRTGMLEQLAMLRRLAGTPLPPVIVAGYGTEQLADPGLAGVSFRGSLGWPELRCQLAGAAALWVHQAPMSGALTRITESLVAGVPVIANGWAARGHAAMPGLEVYADDADFIARVGGLPPTAPAPCFAVAEGRFVAALRDAAGVAG
jgi:hypothetical protein